MIPLFACGGIRVVYACEGHVLGDKILYSKRLAYKFLQNVPTDGMHTGNNNKNTL